jgi:hypothetical protein
MVIKPRMVMTTTDGKITRLKVAPNTGSSFTRKDINNLRKWCDKFIKMEGVLSCTLEEDTK